MAVNGISKSFISRKKKKKKKKNRKIESGVYWVRFDRNGNILRTEKPTKRGVIKPTLSGVLKALLMQVSLEK
jgi:NurA-like 5'-3' nuclease